MSDTDTKKPATTKAAEKAAKPSPVETSKPTLKCMVICPTGNAGKTTTSVYLLYPRLEDPAFFSVEINNLSAKDWGVKGTYTFEGKEFPEMLREAMLSPGSVIADIGASTNAEFTITAAEYEGSLTHFDLFVIPVVDEDKNIAEAMRAVVQLHSLGIDPNRIRLLPNRIKRGKVREGALHSLFDFVTDSKQAWINEGCYIPESALFRYLGTNQLSASDLADGAEYMRRAKEATDRKEAAAMMDRYIHSTMANQVTKTLDHTFALLTKDL